MNEYGLKELIEGIICKKRTVLHTEHCTLFSFNMTC